MHSVVNFIERGELADIFNVWNDAQTLYYDNFEHCGELDIIATLQEKCQNGCSFVDALQNVFVKNVLETLGDLSVIADGIMKLRFSGLTNDQIYEQTLSLGKHLGNVVASAFDIHGTQI